MRRFIEISLRFVLFLGVLASAPGAYALYTSRQSLAEQELALRNEWARIETAVMADAARWQAHPLFTPHPGGEASALIFSHIGVTVGAPTLVDPFKNADWATFVDTADLTPFQTQWLESLSTFGFWSLDGPGSPLANQPIEDMTPTPSFGDLRLMAKAHLVRGLRAGDARTAARDVRELARLCLSAEQVLAAVVGVELLRTETKAFTEAKRRGHDTEGWEPLPDEATTSLKRLLFASPAPFSFLATPPVSTAVLPVGACVGLAEGLWAAHLQRHVARPEFDAHYAALTARLAASTCRLAELRAQWGRPPTTPFSGAGALPYLPFGRAALATELVQIAQPSWLRFYK